MIGKVCPQAMIYEAEDMTTAVRLAQRLSPQLALVDVVLGDGEDGILTAFETSGLDLNGTELVVLAACETGMGQTSDGEGVFGLQRAFRNSGAQSIVMSLWKIPDRESAELMTGFYTRWLEGMSKREALRASALGILRHSRAAYGHGHPLLWGGFILAGNPN